MKLALPPEGFALEVARAEDFEALLALRLRAMRPSLERLGRYDEQRARVRLADGFDPARAQHIVIDGERVGFFVLKPLTRAWRLDHFYIDPPAQGRGIGSRVLQWIIANAQQAQMPVELVALKQSESNRFYLRHGFVATGDGPWDTDYVRLPHGMGVQTVRALWSAFQDRDWTRARALLAEGFEARWWTSGEHFTTADGFIEAQATYPEGWAIRVIECARLDDGRVMSMVRVDHPPGTFYATSFFRVQDGQIIAIDEYWATAEAPPAWRDALDARGRKRFDALDDPRAQTP